MRTTDIVQESWAALLGHKFRSFLTIVGIIIGVFSVSMMLALGQGVKDLIQKQFQAFSSGDVSVLAEGDPLSKRDLTWIIKQPYTTSVIAIAEEYTKITVDGKSFQPVATFVLGPFEDIRNLKVLSGSVFDWNDPDLQRQIVVVDKRFAERFEKKTGKPIFPGKLTVRGQNFTVQGVVDTGAGGFSFGDGIIYLPNYFGETQFQHEGYTEIAIKLKDKSRFQVASDHLLRGMNTIKGYAPDASKNIQVSSDEMFASEEKKMNFYFTLFLAAIGSISLIVGGIGTMNMMLTTVTERTKELGLRKAVGAHDKDITKQILCESVMLTGTGGVIGVLLTYGVTEVVNMIIPFFFSGFTIIVDPLVVGFSVGIAVLTGIVFGWHPAQQAARLPVVDALRSD
jgi:ABC-type antimicrobial peptide transport system permease subunit